MEHHAPETADEVEQEKDQSEPQADGDSGGPAETVADEAIVDGRLSGLPPNYDTDAQVDGADSPAVDAEVQSHSQHEPKEED